VDINGPVALASSVRKVTRNPMDNVSFFFWFDFDLPQTALELSFGGLQK
jgi:hypothetical protein